MVVFTRVLCAIAIVLFLVLMLIVVSGRTEVVTRDRILYYDFKEGSGTVVNDKSGVAPLINLTIPDPAKVEWIGDGLRVKEATLLSTSDPRTKLSASKFFSSGITIEAWAKPLNNTQSGPARIVTYSLNSSERNFTLGQDGDRYQQRLRTSVTGINGMNPFSVSPVGSIATSPSLQHVVYTRDSSGSSKFYINKKEVASLSVLGDGSTWNESYGFGLFNEISYPSEARSWLGDIFSLAIYSTVLTPSEIIQNYESGSKTGSVTLVWDDNTEKDLAGYKIYYGLTSRYDSAVVAKVPAKIKLMCKLPDEGELTEDQQKCKTSWENYCSLEDPVCDSDYFSYDTIVDVGNFTTYVVEGLLKGKTYYFAATAYDEDRDESKFSVELPYTGTGISTILDFRLVE